MFRLYTCNAMWGNLGRIATGSEVTKYLLGATPQACNNNDGEAKYYIDNSERCTDQSLRFQRIAGPTTKVVKQEQVNARLVGVHRGMLQRNDLDPKKSVTR